MVSRLGLLFPFSSAIFLQITGVMTSLGGILLFLWNPWFYCHRGLVLLAVGLLFFSLGRTGIWWMNRRRRFAPLGDSQTAGAGLFRPSSLASGQRTALFSPPPNLPEAATALGSVAWVSMPEAVTPAPVKKQVPPDLSAPLPASYLFTTPTAGPVPDEAEPPPEAAPRTPFAAEAAPAEPMPLVAATAAPPRRQGTAPL
jgi:hypothetical protein